MFAPEEWGLHQPIALLCAVLLIICFELFVYQNRARFEDGIEANLHAKRDIMCNGSVLDDVAIFGDSKFFSVRPDVVNTALGGHHQVTNYAWPFMGIEAFDAMLHTYLNHKKAPKIILLDARPELVGMPERANAMAAEPTHRVRAYEALPWRELLAAIRADDNWYLLWDRVAYAMQPPSAAHKLPVWQAVRSLVRGRGWPTPTDDYLRMTGDFQETGAFLMHRKREVNESEVRELEKMLGPYGVYRSQKLIDSFDRFLTRAGDAGTTVLMLGIPLPPPLNDRLDQVGAYQGYRGLTDQWAKRHPNFHVVEPLFRSYPIENFGDPGHLNLRGNERFQKDYADTLAAWRSALP
jgi:hypothetical protein